MNTNDSNQSSAETRVILDELSNTRRALTALMRKMEGIEASGKHAEAQLHAARAEIAEARALIKNGAANAAGQPSPITKLIQTVSYRPPRSTTAFQQAAESKGPRLFSNGREVISGQISHVTRAKDALTGALIELPCGYDSAYKFLSMETVNRRLHWHGSRAIYSVMIDLCLRVGFIERAGRGFA